MKKIFCRLLVLFIFWAGMSVTAYADEIESDLEVGFHKYHNVSMDGKKYEDLLFYKGKNDNIRILELISNEKVLSVPSRIGNYAVDSIGYDDEAMTRLFDDYKDENGYIIPSSHCEWNKKVKRFDQVIIGEGITTVGNGTFATLSAEVVELPKSLKKIGYRGFAGSEINKVIVRGKDTIIEESCFRNSSLTSIQLPQAYSGTIGDQAFMDSNLKSFRWPYKENNDIDKSTIGSEAFRGSSIQKITFSKKQKQLCIPEACFYECSKMKKIIIPKWIKEVRYNYTPYANNLKSGVNTLVIKGKQTKLYGVETRNKLMTVGKIIAPRKSRAIQYAKKALKIKKIKDKAIVDYISENDIGLNKEVLKLCTFARMTYSYI